MATSLEKKAEKNILESIDKLVVTSFLMLLFESTMVASHPELKGALKEKSVKGIYDYVKQTIINLPHIIDVGGDEKEFHLRKSLQLKDKLLEVYEIIKIYMSACNIMDLCIEDCTQNTEKDTDGISLTELKKLLKVKAELLLSDAVKYDVEETAAAILFTVLPNNFTDNELIDYIDYSVKFYLDNSPQKKGMSHIEQIMQSFAPQKMPEYGKYYPKEADRLYSIIDSVRASGFSGDFKKTAGKYDKIFVKIEGISDVISSLYTELTYISIVLSSMFTFDDILKNNLIYKDFFAKTSEMLAAAEMDEVIVETLMTSLDKTIEEEIEQLNELAKRKELIYKNVNFENFSENTKTLFSMEFFMTTAFFENIEDAGEMNSEMMENDDKKFADLKTIQKEMKTLRLFIKENCLGMSDALKKSARRNLFLSVPLASFYTKDKMTEYIERLCASVKNASEIEGALGSIEKILDDGVLQKLSILEM